MKGFFSYSRFSFLTLGIFSLFLCSNTWAQTSIEGVVIDKESGQTIPFVNIGVPGKNVGTVSLRDGKYSLDGIPKNAFIVFSMVGYTSRKMKVEKVEDTTYLSKSNELLEEVIVRNKKLKEGSLGNKTSSKIIYGGYDEDFLGAEAGVRMKIKRSPTWVNSFRFFISFNDYDSLRFRVNVYEMDGDSVGKRLLRENVIIEDAKEGWNSVDLEPYNIVARKNFLVTLEWLTDFPCNKTEINDQGDEIEACRLMFSATLLKRHIFYRHVSQGEFQKFTGGSLGFVVDVEY